MQQTLFIMHNIYTVKLFHSISDILTTENKDKHMKVKTKLNEAHAYRSGRVCPLRWKKKEQLNSPGTSFFCRLSLSDWFP